MNGDHETIKRRVCIVAAVLAMVLVSVERACVPDSETAACSMGASVNPCAGLLAAEAVATAH
jgi:hypothetical protein